MAAWDASSDDLDPGTVDRAPDPSPFVVPDGLYLVTDVYAGDVVTRTGDTTTYATNTVNETPGRDPFEVNHRARYYFDQALG